MDIFFYLHYCLFKIKEKKEHSRFLFFHVVPKSYRTVTPEPRYIPNFDICVRYIYIRACPNPLLLVGKKGQLAQHMV